MAMVHRVESNIVFTSRSYGGRLSAKNRSANGSEIFRQPSEFLLPTASFHKLGFP
jgi:hypothetical protein